MGRRSQQVQALSPGVVQVHDRKSSFETVPIDYRFNSGEGQGGRRFSEDSFNALPSQQPQAFRRERPDFFFLPPIFPARRAVPEFEPELTVVFQNLRTNDLAGRSSWGSYRPRAAGLGEFGQRLLNAESGHRSQSGCWTAPLPQSRCTDIEY